ncbi:MAG: ATP-binding cassette domain-containing protein, partial [Kiritimatiellia bacterium]|nr:ATP-binding cassette domain-containing protein [Kiritimatiellia bacterium]
MSLLSLKQVHIAFGGPALLEAGTLQIERDERVCLVGRNGEGKSTLLKVLAGEILPDRGEVVRARDVRISHLAQQPSGDLSGTVYEQVALDWTHEHESDHPIEKLLSQLNLDPDMPCSALSGGQRRRTLLARALVNDPDVLLLDEPTNHLDLEAIQWLETFLLRRRGTLLFVTHDRMFLRRLATRILELDRGRLTSWACDYETYLQRRQTLLEAEAGQWAEFDRKLAAEEVWIRKGIRARRTRNEGRVRELMRMREERGARRERVGTARLQAQEAGRSGDKVIEAQGLCGGYDGKEVFQDLSTRITRGDRVGIIGPNGCGKTTLIRTLLGLLPPLRGTVRYGTQLELAFFDQHREGLDPNRTVKENL